MVDPLAGGEDELGLEADPSMEQPEEEDPEEQELNDRLEKKVDDAVRSAVKGHGYITDYRHQESSKIHPFALMTLETNELMNVRRIVRNKMGMETMDDRIGTYDDPQVQFYQDMLSFLDKIIDIKKRNASDEKAKDSKTPKAKTMEPSKNEGMKKYNKKNPNIGS